jgi:hypothetical protein
MIIHTLSTTVAAVTPTIFHLCITYLLLLLITTTHDGYQKMKPFLSTGGRVTLASHTHLPPLVLPVLKALLISSWLIVMRWYSAATGLKLVLLPLATVGGGPGFELKVPPVTPFDVTVCCVTTASPLCSHMSSATCVCMQWKNTV